MAGLGDKQVALIKHRCLKKIREKVAWELKEPLGGSDLLGREGGAGAMLTETWEQLRPSCPKRSTIGAHLLGTLDDAWDDYVAFHLHKLGCRFCRANLEDLQREEGAAATSAQRDRILESTVGFLRQSYRAPRGQ